MNDRVPTMKESCGCLRVNVGCGSTPTSGYLNFDNSPSVRLANYPRVCRLLLKVGLLEQTQFEFATKAAASGNIRWADAARHIPVPDASCVVLYSSHMFEHLGRAGVDGFLREARRILAPNGVLRIVVPDLMGLARRYVNDGDADRFVGSTLLVVDEAPRLAGRIQALALGSRNHRWMYDAASLTRLLREHAFLEPQSLPAGTTTIPDPGGLDLREREEDSVYVEARVPTA